MSAAALQFAPAGAPSGAAVMARAAAENFPVAARLLAPRHRRALLAVYGFARLADELGDELDGDRLAALDWLQDELDRAYAGRARTPLLISLQSALSECKLPREPFLRLIEANRMDQRVARYQSWEQLRGYCELSANPVGELVLAIFELHTPERVRLSDSVCTGLQLTEHLQDVGEDQRRGRFYIPQQDIERLGSLRATVEFEVERARKLLWAGAPLAASIPGWRPKLAIAAFAGGGLAALEQIERAACEVLHGVPAAGGRRRARWLVRVLRCSRSTSP
ncbi:MAG TPA: squalene/phytoene synthase family protein [Solirubrobacteraceae bacterium]|jgi:squalene synthase HpnC|nr:squalene/phytoene synthase family protein [Solirubrobacteraceae bacterium]